MIYNSYSFSELAHVHLVYEECICKSLAPPRRYAKTFPDRQILHPSTFAATDRMFRNEYIFLGRTREHSRSWSVRTVDGEKAVLNTVEENLHPIVRIAGGLNVSKSTVYRTLREQLQLYRLTRIHEIFSQDNNKRIIKLF